MSKEFRKEFVTKKGDKAVFLFFKLEENGKYSFTSNDEQLQKQWIDKKDKASQKYIKESAIRFVVKAAETFLKTPQTVEQKKAEEMGLKVLPESLTTWEDDPISTLQIFCQKNRLPLPEYKIIPGLTVVTLKMGDITIKRNVGIQQESKQECARAYYREYLKEKTNDEVTTSKPVETKTPTPETPDPSTIQGWESHPWYALQDYYEKYNIPLDYSEFEPGIHDIKLTVGDHEYYDCSEDYTHRELNAGKSKDALARMYYRQVIKPQLAKKNAELSAQTTQDDWRPVMHMMDGTDWDWNINWTVTLNQLAQKAQLPTPTDSAYIIENGQKKNFKMIPLFKKVIRRQGDINVVLHIPGLEAPVRGTGTMYAVAKNNAARDGLHLLWLRSRIKELQEISYDDPMVQDEIKSYQRVADTVAKKALIGTKKHESKERTTSVAAMSYDASLEALKDKFNKR